MATSQKKEIIMFNKSSEKIISQTAAALASCLTSSLGNLSKQKQFLIGSLVGGLLGATAALLFAPKSGRQLMNDIVHRFESDKKSPTSKHRTGVSAAQRTR